MNKEINLSPRINAQHPIVNYDNTFASIAYKATVRMALAMATENKWPVYHIHVKSIFLKRDLKEDVYIERPSSFQKSKSKGWFAAVSSRFLVLGMRRDIQMYLHMIREN